MQNEKQSLLTKRKHEEKNKFRKYLGNEYTMNTCLFNA